MSPHRRSLRFASGALLAYTFFALVLIVSQGGHVERFLRLGEETATGRFAPTVLGPDTQVPFTQGHDGQYFWIVAHDPLVLEPDRWAGRIDHTNHRYQRVLYPLLASPSLVFGEQALLWTMLILNLVAVFAGSYVTTRLAFDVGATARAGIAFAANLAVFLGVFFDLADAFQVLAVVAFVWMVQREEWRWALVAAALSGLTKESAIVSVIGVALFAPKLPMRFRVGAAAAAILPTASWAAYLHARFRGEDRLAGIQLPPFRGFIVTITDDWLVDQRWFDAAFGVAAMGGAVWVLVRWVRRRNLLMAASAPWAVSTFLGTQPVFNAAYDSVRSLGPAMTLVALDVASVRWPATPAERSAADRARAHTTDRPTTRVRGDRRWRLRTPST